MEEKQRLYMFIGIRLHICTYIRVRLIRKTRWKRKEAAHALFARIDVCHGTRTCTRRVYEQRRSKSINDDAIELMVCNFPWCHSRYPHRRMRISCRSQGNRNYPGQLTLGQNSPSEVFAVSFLVLFENLFTLVVSFPPKLKCNAFGFVLG